MAGGLGLTPGRRAGMLRDIWREHEARMADIEREMAGLSAEVQALVAASRRLGEAQGRLAAKVRRHHDETWALATRAMAEAWPLDHERARAGRGDEGEGGGS